MGMIAVLIGTAFALIVRSRLSVEKPGSLQQVAEMLLTNPLEFGIRDLLVENVGHEGVRYVPFVGAISIFILISNLLAVFPFLVAPTGTVTVPLACATLTFLYFNWQGARHHGVGGYLKTFAGSPHGVGGWLLALLLFPVEIISTTARLLSLTVRLWSSPPSVATSASIVPSPPSPMGISSASSPPSRSPSDRACATSRAENVPLKLSGATRTTSA